VRLHPSVHLILPRHRSRAQALLASEKLLNTPFLILGNKIDLATAVSEEQLKMQLGLTGATTGKETTALPKDMRPIEVYMCSIMRKTGYGEGLKWLTNFV
jgi:GTP-binding protein SAR1